MLESFPQYPGQNILLTNDDGVGSPLLPITIESLAGCHELRVVIPDEEQSWKAKSMTRFSPLSMHNREVARQVVHCVNGTPADCANLGIYQFGQTRPDLVVSGINIGLNVGLGFALSSGTLGACFEANIAGITGVAFSQSIDEPTIELYWKNRTMSAETAERLRQQCLRLVAKVLARLISNQDLMRAGLTWNVNFPWHAAPDCRLVVCDLSNSIYGSCFLPRHDSLFRHEVQNLVIDTAAQSDWNLLEQGCVTITPIDVRKLGKVNGADSALLQRYFD